MDNVETEDANKGIGYSEVSESEVIAAMKEFGGGFVKKLAEAYDVADPSNREIIRTAFPSYWSFYAGMAIMDKARRDMDARDEEGE